MTVHGKEIDFLDVSGSAMTCIQTFAKLVSRVQILRFKVIQWRAIMVKSRMTYDEQGITEVRK